MPVLIATFIVMFLIAMHVWWNYRKTLGIAQFAETMVPPTGRFVTVRGRKFHIEDRGQGMPVVFIHGLGGNLHHFDIPLWSHMGKGFRLIAIDRRGSGYSEQDWRDDGSVATHAADIAAVLDEIGVDKALYVGHSMGGAIALAAALTTPEKVAGLALIAPLTAVAGSTPKAFRLMAIRSPWWRRFMARTYAIPAEIKATETILDFVFGPQSPPDDFAVGGAALTGVRPSHFYAASTDMMSLDRDFPGVAANVGDITVPVGVIFGSADRVLDYRIHGESMIHRLPGTQLQVLKGVGHMVQYAEPKKTAAFLKKMAGMALPA